MKELSIEEKAKRYDEALAFMQGWILDENGLVHVRPKDIFPELKENEDERMREWLINLVKSHIEWLEDRIKEQLSNGQVYGEELNEAKDAIAWLEKQCQAKDSAISQHENETCKENGNSLTSEDIRKGLIQYFNTFTLNTFAGIDPKKILSWLEKQGSQILANSAKTCKDEQEPAWSKEDETRIKSIIALLKEPAVCAMDGNKGIIEASIKYLKSLKNRVLPQPKSAWSEEDIVAIDCAVEVLNKDLPTLAASIERLKNLSHKNTWRPSDEQMEALLSKLPVVKGGGDKVQDILESLYQDLLKLR